MSNEYFEHDVISETVPSEGFYKFTTFGTKEHISEKGNKSIKLTLKFSIGGDNYIINDYLSAPYKFKQFWESVGKIENYERGKNLITDYDNQSGEFAIAHQEYNGETRLKVKLYQKKEGVSNESKDDFVDDDIPF